MGYRTKSRYSDFLMLPYLCKQDSSEILNYTAFTLVSTNFTAVICVGTNVVDRLDALVKGVVTKDRLGHVLFVCSLFFHS